MAFCAGKVFALVTAKNELRTKLTFPATYIETQLICDTSIAVAMIRAVETIFHEIVTSLTGTQNRFNKIVHLAKSTVKLVQPNIKSTCMTIGNSN